MNKIVNKFLLAGYKFMPDMHLKQPGFTYSACGSFTKNKKRIEKFMQTRNANYICRNDLDKARFKHDAAYGNYKDLNKRTQSERFLRDKSFKIVNNPNFDGLQRGLALMVYKIFDKKSPSLADKYAEDSGIKSVPNQQLTGELYKPFIRKFKRRRVYSSLKGNIWGAGLADIQ